MFLKRAKKKIYTIVIPRRQQGHVPEHRDWEREKFYGKLGVWETVWAVTTLQSVTNLLNTNIIPIYLHSNVTVIIHWHKPSGRPMALDSAFNRNEYQEYFLGVKAAGA